MTDGGTSPTDHRRFPLLDDPERPPRTWRWWLVPAGVAMTVIAVIAVVVNSHSPSSRIRIPTPSTDARPQLPAGAQPLPGARGGPADSFGTLARISVHRSRITRSEALRRYDHMPGVISRRGRNQRVFVALVRAAFIDRGRLRPGTFWIISVSSNHMMTPLARALWGSNFVVREVDAGQQRRVNRIVGLFYLALAAVATGAVLVTRALIGSIGAGLAAGILAVVGVGTGSCGWYCH